MLEAVRLNFESNVLKARDRVSDTPVDGRVLQSPQKGMREWVTQSAKPAAFTERPGTGAFLFWAADENSEEALGFAALEY